MRGSDDLAWDQGQITSRSFTVPDLNANDKRFANGPRSYQDFGAEKVSGKDDNADRALATGDRKAERGGWRRGVDE